MTERLKRYGDRNGFGFANGNSEIDMVPAKTRLDAAVHKAAAQYKELDIQPGMNPCGLSLDCGNIETMEDLLVAATGNWFSRRLDMPFHEVVYAPNRKVETHCGFDLSIGRLNTMKKRLRIQNKTVTRWCDQTDPIVLRAKLKPKDRKNTSADERLLLQVKCLCKLYQDSEGKSQPYLLVQQCYCLHDYRRMGRRDLKSPALDNQLRSMAIDLSDEKFRKLVAKDVAWKFQLDFASEQRRVKCRVLSNIEEPIPLTVLSLKDLVGQLEK